ISLDARRAAARPAAEQLPDPIPSAQMTLVDQLTEWARMRIDERVFRAGMRMPSIRQLAADYGISRFPVIEAYDRLVSLGLLDSRHGSGFYVAESNLTGRDGRGWSDPRRAEA
ncbi:GntR family transcriptional regulator, partial [Stenotrophomonas maltophilia]|uniref:GntR family transcriptional regulator n=1 Tax=Stenotrophomonas maltophilia TaxID=40324 RepID=UPI0013DA1CB2